MESTPTVQQEEGLKPTSTVFGLLALRQARLDSVAYRYAGLQPRMSRQTELYLTCYRIHRQREIEALSPLDWMRHTLTQTRAEVTALNRVALASDDLATVAAALARVEALSEYVEFLSEKLEEVAGG